MAFTFSYSKMKNYLTCPYRHEQIDLKKNYSDSSTALDWGNEVHKALANACSGKAPLPDTMGEYQQYVDKYADPSIPGELLVEKQYAMTKDFQPSGWFRDTRTWYRGVVDLLRVIGPVARAVDWKTGKVQHDSRQLMLNAQVIFAHHPSVKRIYTEFVWLKDGCVTPEVFDRSTIMREWPPVFEVLKDMENAAKTNTYPPKPGGLCYEWCKVTSCQFHGKRNR